MAELTLHDLSKRMKGIDFAMFSTKTEGGEIASRPMSNNGDVEYDGDSWFFTYESYRTASDIERDPKVLIAAQPTRGLDVGAIEFVHRRLIEERDEGRAILLVSLELEEVLSLSDRILVMYEGEIVGEFPPTATEEELGFAMTGGKRSGVAA